MLLRRVLVRIHGERGGRGAGLLLLNERVGVGRGGIALAGGLRRRLGRGVWAGRRRTQRRGVVVIVVGGERVDARALGQAVSRRFPFRAHEVAEARRHLS